MLAALSGCGSTTHTGGTEADPASAIPAGAAVYLGATVRPQGSEGSGALAAGRALTGTADPYLRLLGALRTPGSPPLEYKRDVAPWLGTHAGVYLDSLHGAESVLGPLEKALGGSGEQSDALDFATGGLEGALVMDTSEPAAARSFLAQQARRASARPASYRGVSYEVGRGGVAFGLVKSFAVIGSEAGVRAVIGATQGEPALASAAGYSKLAGSAPTTAIGHLYLNPLAGHSSGGGQGGRSGAAVTTPGTGVAGVASLLAGGRQTDVSLLAGSSSVSLVLDSLAAPGTAPGLLAYDPESAQALGLLPGDSWLALGLGHAGSKLSADAGALGTLASLAGGSSSSAGPISIGSLLGGLLKPLQILGAPNAAARRDYTSWMTSAGIFAAGSSVLELKAGLVFSSNDAARSRAAVGRLASALKAAGDEVGHASVAGTDVAATVRLPGVPLQLVIAAGPGAAGPEFVLGLGEASVQAALSSSEPLSAASSRSAAASTLGETIQPSLIADVPTLLALLESVGLGESLAPVLPYLKATTTVAGGGRALGGEVERFRVTVGLKG